MRIALALLLIAPLAAAQTSCAPHWAQGEFPLTGINGDVFTMTSFDDGSGPALFIGGSFSLAGTLPANNVVKWDGLAWSAVGGGLDGQVTAMAVYDDGNGPALYAGGNFTSRVSRWNGTTWSPVGMVLVAAAVNVLAVHDDGSGAKLVAGGTAGIAAWNGFAWSGLGGGVNGSVRSLASCNTLNGPRLYVGGLFTTAGSVSANKIACWDGTSWSNLGSGPTTGGFITNVVGIMALASWDDGSGESLYVGGDFTSIAGYPASSLARWNGSAWVPLPYPLPAGTGTDVLATLPTGSGLALHAVGGCQVRKLTASGWSTLPCAPVTSSRTLTTFDQGSGPALCVAGSLGPVSRWTGSAWAALGTGLSSMVEVVASLDDGTGPALYAGGAFLQAGGMPVNCIAKRTGSTWTPLGTGVSGVGSQFGGPPVEALAVFNDGSGRRIYAGGGFAVAGGVPALNIARWDGSAWSALGPGLAGGRVRAMATGNLGSGERLFVGGSFVTAGTLIVNSIAQWDGANWSALGSGMPAFPNGPAWVESLVVYDDGSGPALYAGGQFAGAGGTSASGIARWNGTSWAPVGSNGTTALALAVHDDGTGPALYATGATGAAAAIMKWNGASWSSIGSGLGFTDAMTSFDDGSGPALWIAGAYSASQPGISRWNGLSWSTPGSGFAGSIAGWTQPMARSLAVADDGGGPALFVGGEFVTVNGQVSAGVAKWTAGGPPVVKVQPLTQAVDPGAVATLSVSAIGAPVLGYQWRRDGVAVPGAVAPAFAVPTGTPGDVAAYDVVITNPCGQATSAPAYVFVRPAILTMTQPQGAGSILVANSSGIPGSAYFTAVTLAVENLSNPGNGLWLGLHIPYPELVSEFATQSAPFVGVLDASGGSAFAAPAGSLPAALSGTWVFAVTAIYDPLALMVTGGSTIASLQLL